MIKNSYDFCIGSNQPKLRKKLTNILIEGGFHASGEGKDTPEFLRALRTIQPWLAVIDTSLPPGNIEQLAEIIENDTLAAAIYINTSGVDLDLYVQLNWPVDAPVLTAVAETVCSEFVHKKKLRKEIEELENKLYERKLIEKAKGVLAKIYKLNEDEAYKLLRKSSMEQRISMTEISAKVIKNPDSLSS
ncbi:MAG: ANTAR domain-containing protein [Bacillota bacterium]